MPIRRRTVGRCHFVVFAAALCFVASVAGQTSQAQAPISQITEAQRPPAQELQWKTYSFPADGFSADFPFEPSQSRKVIDSSSGAYPLRSYMAQDDQSALYVGVCDYGSKAKDQDPNDLLNNAEDGALKNSNSRLVNEQAITLGIYQGLEFKAENGSTELSARLYVVGTTLYQTLVVTPRGRPYSNTTRFLNSFQLIARPVQ